MDEDEAPSADPVEGRCRVNEHLLNNENPSLNKLVWLLYAVLQLPPAPHNRLAYPNHKQKHIYTKLRAKHRHCLTAPSWMKIGFLMKEVFHFVS